MCIKSTHTHTLTILHVTHSDPFFDYKFLFGKYEPSNKPHLTASFILLYGNVIQLAIATHRSCYVFVCKTHFKLFQLYLYKTEVCLIVGRGI